MENLIEKLLIHGGCIVSSADCSQMEIADARVRGDFWADANGYGYVRRLPEWLARHSRYARIVSPECCERERGGRR